MRLVLICDDYLPKSSRISAKMLHELACELILRGHNPIVICPNDNYTSKVEYMIIDGVSVYKFPNGKIKDVSKIKRAINESLLSFNAWRFLSKNIKKEKIDGIIYYSPSIFFGSLVMKIKKVWQCKSFLILRDSFPQWLVDQQIIKQGSLIERYFKYFEKINYKAADCIGLMSEKNQDIFLACYPKFKNTTILYNWANTIKNNNIKNNKLRDKLSIADKIIFLYGGNIGHAQDMSNIMRLILKMSSLKEAYFLLIGQGDEVDLVKNFISKHALKNCTFLPSMSQDEFKTVLKIVDVGLFSLAKTHSIHNFPGKLLGYMVNSLPILGSVNHGNDLKNIIYKANAGYVFDNGEDEKLLSAAIELTKNSEHRKQLGANAFALLEKKFSVESAANKFELFFSDKSI